METSTLRCRALAALQKCTRATNSSPQTVKNGHTTASALRPLALRSALASDDELLTVKVNGETRVVAADLPTVRSLTYEYVDTGIWAVACDQNRVLWSDAASWCTMVALWTTGFAGMAHVVPGELDVLDSLFKAYLKRPREIHLVTQPAYVEKEDGCAVVLKLIEAQYSTPSTVMRVFVVSGYNGRAWDHQHQLGVDPKSGTYPVFN